MCGTMVVLYNLSRLKSGEPELDFDDSAHDIQTVALRESPHLEPPKVCPTAAESLDFTPKTCDDALTIW